MQIYELEPFACGFLAADRPNMAYRIACGMRESARHMPIVLESDSFFADAINREWRVGINYLFGYGIVFDDAALADEKSAHPELAAELDRIAAEIRPYETEARIHASFTAQEEALHGKLTAEGGRMVRTCWGGTWGGHSNPDYRMVLRLGTDGLRDRIAVGRKMNGCTDFYDALTVALESLDVLGARALAQAKKVGNDALAAQFAHIPQRPPRDFREACQLFWLVFGFDGIDSPGRFDYFMDDFCKTAAPQERKACLQALWTRFHDTRSWNLCIGGSDEKGNYFSNALTGEILEIAREFRYNTPNLTMRVSPSMPAELWQSAAQTIATGIGMPVLYNDACVCPALEDLGIPPADAHNYCMNGCNQIDIFGKSHMGLEDGEVCLAKCLELALHNGRCTRTGARLGPETGDPETFDTYEKLWDAYCTQVKYVTDCAIDMANKAQQVYAEFAPNPLRSNLIQGCVENGRDYKAGGPIYNHGQILAEGIADTADSLAAVKHYIYDTGKYTMAQLMAALDSNFAAEDALYRDFSGYHKFGNDIADVDAVCADVVTQFYTYLLTKRTFRGGIYGGGCSTFNRAANYGFSTGALPNGKRAGDTLMADSVGATPGRDRSGPTALLNSVLKQPHRLAKSGHVLNLKFTPQVFRSPTGQQAFIALAKTYFAKGGQQLSVAVVSADELRDAQLHPERYENLIVRVGGYSDYFTHLPRDLQDNIIARTELDA